jgi:hypothetical protein
VSLARKVRLTGLLLPVADAAGARVTAVDQGVSAAGTVVTATVGGDGSYSLLVDPARPYRLFVDPLPGIPRARDVLEVITSGSQDLMLATRILPTGHLVRGTVTLENAAVRGATVQAFCAVWSARCGDASFSLADTVTDADGRYELRVPDPDPAH